MKRRAFLSFVAAAGVTLIAEPAFAGSYLNRAALLLNGSRAERDMVLPRSNDRELLRIVHDVAKARTASARTMKVPKVIASAHPHLMLVLENCERAYASALNSNHERFVQHVLRARAEDRTFREIVKKMGYTLPITKG